MNITDKRTDKIVDLLLEKYGDEGMEWGWNAEYDNGELLLYYRWSEIKEEYPHVYKYLDSLSYTEHDGKNVTPVHHDEYILDYDHYNERGLPEAWRITGDGWGWICKVRICDGYMLTPSSDVEEWIEECKVDPYYKSPVTESDIPSLPDFIKQEDIEKEGYTLIGEEYEFGFFEKDSPLKIYNDFYNKHKDKLESVVFQLDSAEQFSIIFKVYIKLNEEEA